MDIVDISSDISISKQSELLNVSKSSVYYTPILGDETIKTMNAIDEVYTEFPYFNHRRIREMLETEQGVQYNSKDYIAVLEKTGSIKISMDGQSRCFDNIFTERLWRLIKQEDIYLNDYRDINEVEIGLTRYFNNYNYRRPHQSLNYKTPAEIYFSENNMEIFNKFKINTFTPIVVV